jgi:hypothetical protein
MTSLPARWSETPDGGRPLVIFVDEAAAVLGALHPLSLPFPTRPVRRDLSNGTKEDR